MRRTDVVAPDPPAFAEAVAEIRAQIGYDKVNPLIAPAGLGRLYVHAHSTANAVVLFHGFTNCPQQFDLLARQLFERGANVYVPRIPLHGFRDRLTRALGQLSTAQLTEMAASSYRLTRSLGKRVTAVGLSLGGSLALYLEQTEALDHAVALAPFLMPIGFPDGLGLSAMQALARLPDFYVWWDPRIKEKALPLYAYPGFPVHALTQCVFFGNVMVSAAQRKHAPLGRRCTLVVNAGESAVNNRVAVALIENWRKAGATCDQVTIDGLGRSHDIIDPTTFPNGPRLVYPTIEKLVFADGTPA